MKRLLVRAGVVSAVLLASMAISSSAFADAPIRQGGNFGLGLGGGTTASGLSAKYYLTGGQALQMTAGIGAGGNYLGLGVDYLFEMPEFAQTSVVNIGWNIGPGVGVGISDSNLAAAVAFVAGLEFNFNPIPIDLVVEYRPSLSILPGVGLDLVGFSGHLRFYF